MFHFQFLGWPFLFLTLAVRETEKEYNYAFGSELIMNNEERPAIDLWCVYIKVQEIHVFMYWTNTVLHAYRFHSPCRRSSKAAHTQ